MKKRKGVSFSPPFEVAAFSVQRLASELLKFAFVRGFSPSPSISGDATFCVPRSRTPPPRFMVIIIAEHRRHRHPRQRRLRQSTVRRVHKMRFVMRLALSLQSCSARLFFRARHEARERPRASFLIQRFAVDTRCALPCRNYPQLPSHLLRRFSPFFFCLPREIRTRRRCGWAVGLGFVEAIDAEPRPFANV